MARPEHKPNAVTRRKVAIAAGGGMRQEDIAIALSISVPTLRKHYETELSVGAAQKRMAVLEAQFQAATKKGSSAAARIYLEHEPQVAVPPEEAKEPKPRAVGKKDKANADAKTAQNGTDWEGLLDPKVTPIRKPAA